MRKLTTILMTAALLGTAVDAQAQQVLWGNNAQFSAPATIQQWDLATGNLNLVHSGASGNGRGVVVVGNVLYYTLVSDSKIYKMDATTGADLGFIQTSVGSMSTIAFDGTSFWTSDYQNTNRAYRIDFTTGATTKTINLSNACVNTFGYCNLDGMEWFDNKLIANRCDGPFGTFCGIYDIYDLDGNVLVDSFITTNKLSTGIAYDGEYFYTSWIQEGKVGVYDGTTGAFVKEIALGGNPYVEDLSVDYAQRVDFCDLNPDQCASVPEPSGLLLLGTGLFGIAAIRRRRERHLS